MRIITGEARGRILHTPAGNGTRPTDSRSREILFNVLGDRVLGARFLDCYAGSGAVGLEALSRGAEFCCFVEQDHAALRAIRANLKMLGWEDRAQVWQGNVRTALPKMVANGTHFDIVFGDPPFNHPTETREFCQKVDLAASLLSDPSIDRTPALLDNQHVGTVGPEPNDVARVRDLSESETVSGLLVVQHHRRFVPQAMQHFVLRREKRAGESTLSFFEPGGSPKVAVSPDDTPGLASGDLVLSADRIEPISE